MNKGEALGGNCRACCCQMTTVLLLTCTGFSMASKCLCHMPHWSIHTKLYWVFLLFPSGSSVCASAFMLNTVLVKVSACVCPSYSPTSAILMTSQLLRGLPRTKVLASSLLPCKHQSQPGAVPLQAASRWPTCFWQTCQSRSYNTTPVLHSYILTPPQVNSILKANEYSFKVCGFIYNNGGGFFQITTSK